MTFKKKKNYYILFILVRPWITPVCMAVPAYILYTVQFQYHFEFSELTVVVLDDKIFNKVDHDLARFNTITVVSQIILYTLYIMSNIL